MLKFIKEHKWKAILSSTVILMPMLVGTVLWNTLPNSMTMHWGADGSADGSGYKGFVVFGIPLIVLALHWLCLLFTAADPGNKGQNKKAMGLVFWILPVAYLSVSGFLYSTALGKEVNTLLILPVVTALLFIVLGNYLPKISQNSTLGIKLPWTLKSEENWNKTHRLSGKLWVAGGFVILIAMLLPGNTVIPVMIADIILMAAVPTVYSYGLYRKQVKSGHTFQNTGAVRGYKASLAIVLIVLAVLAVLMFTGDIHVEVGAEALSIEASYYADLTVPYEDIDSVEFRESDIPGYRDNGFGSPRLRMGLFQNDEFGSYTRYSYTGAGACIVLKNGDDVLVISGRNEAETRGIYEKLQELIS